MLRKQRLAKDHSEQMILNNYQSMLFIKEFRNKKMTPKVIFRLHIILTQETLDDPEKAGQLRTTSDDISVVEARTQELLHMPPDAIQLPERLRTLCDFANSNDGSHQPGNSHQSGNSHQLDKSRQLGNHSSEKKVYAPCCQRNCSSLYAGLRSSFCGW